MMELNADNYYTPEADREFMSCSQYQGWCECEAKQFAKLEGRWVEKPTEAFEQPPDYRDSTKSPDAGDMKF